MEPAVGIEPTTDGLQNRCSTTELRWPPASGTVDALSKKLLTDLSSRRTFGKTRLRETFHHNFRQRPNSQSANNPPAAPTESIKTSQTDPCRPGTKV